MRFICGLVRQLVRKQEAGESVHTYAAYLAALDALKALGPRMPLLQPLDGGGAAAAGAAGAAGGAGGSGGGGGGSGGTGQQQPQQKQTQQQAMPEATGALLVRLLGAVQGGSPNKPMRQKAAEIAPELSRLMQKQLLAAHATRAADPVQAAYAAAVLEAVVADASGVIVRGGAPPGAAVAAVAGAVAGAGPAAGASNAATEAYETAGGRLRSAVESLGQLARAVAAFQGEQVRAC